MFNSLNRDWRMGENVIIKLTDESGRVIAFDSGLYAVENDDTLEVTWHGADELEAD